MLETGIAIFTMRHRYKQLNTLLVLSVSNIYNFMMRCKPKGNLNSLFTGILLVMAASASAQEMLGIMNTNSAGISSALINPASTVTSRNYLDINLLTFDIFEENNYLYLHDTAYRFSRFFDKNAEFPVHGENDQSTYDYYTTSNKQGYANVRIMGPSAMLVRDRHAFGLITGARAVASVSKLPYDVAKFLYDDFDFVPQQDINYIHNDFFSGAGLSWAEIGGNYSYIFKRDGFSQWSAGVNLRYLAGHAGAFTSVDKFDYIVYDLDTLQVNHVTGEAGVSLPLDYETNDYTGRPLFRGKGIGMDIGVVYERKVKGYQNWDKQSLCSQPYTPYLYRIGVSILDIGRIRFNRNAYFMTMDDASTFWPGISALDFTTMNNFTGEISYHFLGDSTAVIADNSFKVGLPTALSLQADYNFYKNWYINSTAIFPVKMSRNVVVRESLISVTPRYETKNFAVSLPISLFNYYDPRVGIALRYRGFFIGSENPAGFFSFSDFTGLDFYMGIRISLAKGDCGTSSPADCTIEESSKFRKQKTGKPKMGLGISQ